MNLGLERASRTVHQVLSAPLPHGCAHDCGVRPRRACRFIRAGDRLPVWTPLLDEAATATVLLGAVVRGLMGAKLRAPMTIAIGPFPLAMDWGCS